MNAVYARQSVDKLDSLSIETQIESCTKNIEGEVRIYRDKGFSGKNTKRPAFQQMLKDIKAGKINKVWVYRLDRFSRSISDFGQLWKILEKNRVEFESISEKFDTSTPSGRAMLNIIMTFAQLERETIAERVRDNYYHRFSLGGWPGGPAPLGFDIGRTTDAGGRHISTLIPNAQADLVQRIFAGYLAPNASCSSIAKQLTEGKVAGIQRKGWDNVAISRILKNPVYVMADADIYLYFVEKKIPVAQPIEAFAGVFGCNLVGKRDRSESGKTTPRLALANHPGIIPSDTWLACQEKLAHKRQIDRSHMGKYSWLSGLMKCGKCGYAVKVNHIKGNFYLHCSGHTNLNICDEKLTIDLRELEGEVERELIRMLRQCPQENAPECGNHIREEELRQIDSRIERLLGAFAESSSVTTKYLNQEIAKLDQKRQQLLRQKSGVQTKGLNKIDFETLNMAEKKMVAASFINQILLSQDRAEIIWKV